jgi:hypothetical protein
MYKTRCLFWTFAVGFVLCTSIARARALKSAVTDIEARSRPE